MSRSYRKPWVVDRNQLCRKLHNRYLRRLHWSEDIPDGKAFRKFCNPWDITDWRWPAYPPTDHEENPFWTMAKYRRLQRK